MNFEKWQQYFQDNKNHFDHIQWEVGERFSKADRVLLAPSLQQFQRGEYSEGKHLLAYAREMGDPHYLEAIKLFIREEQDHAMVLGRLMELEGIAVIRHHWIDGIFRKLRQLAGLENTLLVLLSAEIIAKIYYRVLWNAHYSPLLDECCLQILKDEDEHIAFQCDAMHQLFLKRSAVSRIFTRSWHRLLMMGTIAVVWFSHRRVLRRGHYNAERFFLETMLVFNRANRAVIHGKEMAGKGPATDIHLVSSL